MGINVNLQADGLLDLSGYLPGGCHLAAGGDRAQSSREEPAVFPLQPSLPFAFNEDEA